MLMKLTTLRMRLKKMVRQKRDITPNPEKGCCG